MVDLDDSIREDLARLRGSWAPSEIAKRRMWTALESRLGPGPPDDPGSMGPPGSGTIGFAAKVAAATLAMTGAGLLTLRLAVVAVRGVAPDEPIEVAEAPHEQAREPTPTPEVGHAPVAAQPIAAPSPEQADPLVKRPRIRPPAPPDDPGVDRSLAAELALLQAASDASSPEAALRSLDAHLDEFPTGQLADERDLMRIETLCGLGRLAAARSVADGLRRRGSGVASRAREVCPAIDE